VWGFDSWYDGVALRFGRTTNECDQSSNCPARRGKTYTRMLIEMFGYKARNRFAQSGGIL